MLRSSVPADQSFVCGLASIRRELAAGGSATAAAVMRRRPAPPGCRLIDDSLDVQRSPAGQNVFANLLDARSDVVADDVQPDRLTAVRINQPIPHGHAAAPSGDVVDRTLSPVPAAA